MITPIKNNYYNQQHLPIFQPTFMGGLSSNAEKHFRKIEFCARKVVNTFSDYFQKQNNEQLYNDLLTVERKSPQYMRIMSQVGRLLSTPKELEINLEDKRIEKIAKSGKPHIFIMNHDRQTQDPQMLAFFTTLLSEEYVKTGQAHSCPRPRIILNEDIILSMDEQNKQIFEKMGAVPIDASLNSPDSRKNAVQFLSLVREFIRGESNIFIFPEGKNAIWKDMPLKNKFALGTGEIVNKLTDKMPEVNIVPIGFGYPKKGLFNKSKGNSIYIGETVTFRKEDNHIYSNVANLTSRHTDKEFVSFFNSRKEAILTEKGIPVEGKEIPYYINGILCENLRVCKDEALERLPDKKKEIIEL